MASTRNKNTPGDYCLQQKSYTDARMHIQYKHGAYGEAYDSRFAGNGLNPGQMPWNTLSHNYADIESFLYGINSTNLVKPQAPVVPQLKKLPTFTYFNTLPLIMPLPLVVENNQRPYPI